MRSGGSILLALSAMQKQVIANHDKLEYAAAEVGRPGTLKNMLSDVTLMRAYVLLMAGGNGLGEGDVSLPSFAAPEDVTPRPYEQHRCFPGSSQQEPRQVSSLVPMFSGRWAGNRTAVIGEYEINNHLCGLQRHRLKQRLSPKVLHRATRLGAHQGWNLENQGHPFKIVQAYYQDITPFVSEIVLAAERYETSDPQTQFRNLFAETHHDGERSIDLAHVTPLELKDAIEKGLWLYPGCLTAFKEWMTTQKNYTAEADIELRHWQKNGKRKKAIPQNWIASSLRKFPAANSEKPRGIWFEHQKALS